MIKRSPFKLCVIDEFADLDIFREAGSSLLDQRVQGARRVDRVRDAHFDQADSLGVAHRLCMCKVLSPIHPLATYAPYQEILPDRRRT
jgi:hypothetical protein